jgi:phosphoglycolate phosphatase
VLVDSRRAFVRCVNHALASVGVAPRAAEELHPFLGPPLHATFASLADESLADACVDAYRERYRDAGFAESSVFEGMNSALAALCEPAIVVTSKPLALAEPLLRAVGLRERFAAVFGRGIGTEAELRDAGADAIARTPAELPALLTRHV